VAPDPDKLGESEGLDGQLGVLFGDPDERGVNGIGGGVSGSWLSF
jgi:hypothetical protein